MTTFTQKILQELSWHKISVDPNSFECFYRSQWQYGETSALYTLYRIAFALYFLITTLISIDSFPENCRLKWFLYLTDWGYVLNTMQALISCYLVMEINEWTAKSFWFVSPTIATCYHRKLCKIYWITHTLAVDIAFAISSMYWVMVYDPSAHDLDFLNLTMHTYNSIAMAIDLFMVGHPINLLHIYWPIGFALIYYTFTYLYHLMGGTDENGKPYIYSILRWENFRKCFVMMLTSTYHIATLHVLTFFLYMLRTFIHKQL